MVDYAFEFRVAETYYACELVGEYQEVITNRDKDYVFLVEFEAVSCGKTRRWVSINDIRCVVVNKHNFKNQDKLH